MLKNLISRQITSESFAIFYVTFNLYYSIEKQPKIWCALMFLHQNIQPCFRETYDLVLALIKLNITLRIEILFSVIRHLSFPPSPWPKYIRTTGNCCHLHHTASTCLKSVLLLTLLEASWHHPRPIFSLSFHQVWRDILCCISTSWWWRSSLYTKL